MSEFYHVPHIDWLAVTTKVSGSDRQKSVAEQVIFLLGGPTIWRLGRGLSGYESSYRHGSGAVVLFGGTDDMGVHLSLPSQALAYFGDVLFEVLDGWDWEASRIDIAVDTDAVTVDWVLENLDSVVTKTKHRVLVTDLVTGGKTLYLGSPKSGRKLIRIYDKAAQSSSLSVWTRVEVQLRKEFARAAYRALRNGVPLADILKRSVDFREPGDGDVYRLDRLRQRNMTAPADMIARVVGETAYELQQREQRERRLSAAREAAAQLDLARDGARPLPSWVNGEPDTSAAGVVVLQSVPAPAIDDRIPAALRLISLYREVIDTEEVYGTLTGRFADTLAVKRGLTAMIGHLESLIAAIEHPEEAQS